MHFAGVSPDGSPTCFEWQMHHAPPYPFRTSLSLLLFKTKSWGLWKAGWQPLCLIKYIQTVYKHFKQQKQLPWHFLEAQFWLISYLKSGCWEDYNRYQVKWCDQSVVLNEDWGWGGLVPQWQKGHCGLSAYAVHVFGMKTTVMLSWLLITLKGSANGFSAWAGHTWADCWRNAMCQPGPQSPEGWDIGMEEQTHLSPLCPSLPFTFTPNHASLCSSTHRSLLCWNRIYLWTLHIKTKRFNNQSDRIQFQSAMCILPFVLKAGHERQKYDFNWIYLIGWWID